MAKKVELTLDVKGNIEATTKNLKELKKQLRETAAGSDDFKKITNQIDDLEDKLKGSREAAGDWVDQLASAPGPLGAIGGALNKAKLATVSFGAAFKAAGIGLIVSAIAGIAAAFSSTEETGKKLQPLLIGFQKIFNGIFRALEPVFNTLVELATKAMPYVTEAFGVAYSAVSSFLQGLGLLGRAIGKLIKGDFSGAWDDATEAVTGFGDRYDEANKNFIKGTQELTSTEKEELEKRKEEEKKKLEERRKQQEEYRKKVAEDTKTANDKLRSLEEESALLLIKDERKRAEKELEFQMKKEKAEIEALTIDKKLRNQLLEELEKNGRIKRGQINETYDKKDEERRIEFNNKIKDIETQAIADETQRELQARQDRYDREIAALEKDVTFLEKTEKEKAKIRKDYATILERDLAKITEDGVLKRIEKERKYNDLLLASNIRTTNTLETNVNQVQLKIIEQIGLLEGFFKGGVRELEGYINYLSVDFVTKQKKQASDLKSTYYMELDTIQNNIKLEKESLDKSLQDKQISREKYNERINELNNQELQANIQFVQRMNALAQLEIASKRAVQDALMQIGENTVNFLSTIAGKNVELQKAAAIAEGIMAIARVVIDTQRANVAFTASVAPLGPAGVPIAASYVTKNTIASGIAIATIIAQGINRLKTISEQQKQASTKTSGTSRGMARGGYIDGPRHAQGGVMIEAEGGEAVMTRGAVTMFGPLLSMMNQAGGGTNFSRDMMFTPNDAPSTATGGDQQTPIIMKTYVVSNELTTEQERQARLKQLSTL